MITYEELAEVLDYFPDTGDFIWKESRGSRAIKGCSAGTITPDGYVSIRVKGHIYRAHRLAWLYCFREWPEQFIDHINGNRQDNRLDNLREATKTQNSYNTKVHKDNGTGVKGVYYNKANNNYRAQIRYNGKTISLGSFKTIEEASEVYNKKAIEIHGEFYAKDR